jgi:hypothetical protein
MRLSGHAALTLHRHVVDAANIPGHKTKKKMAAWRPSHDFRNVNYLLDAVPLPTPSCRQSFLILHMRNAANKTRHPEMKLRSVSRYDAAMMRLSNDTVRHKMKNKYAIQNLPTSVRWRASDEFLLRILIVDEFIGHRRKWADTCLPPVNLHHRHGVTKLEWLLIMAVGLNLSATVWPSETAPLRYRFRLAPTLAEREDISRGITRDLSLRAIAVRLGRPATTSTIARRTSN